MFLLILTENRAFWKVFKIVLIALNFLDVIEKCVRTKEISTFFKQYYVVVLTVLVLVLVAVLIDL